MLFKHLHTYGKFFSPDGDSGGGTGADADGGTQDQDAGNGAGDDANEGDDETAGLKSALEKERARAKSAEKELKAIQKRLADIENAGKPEADKQAAALTAANDRVSTLEQRLRDASARGEVLQAATKANAIDTEAIYALVSSRLEYDDDLNVTNVDEVMAQAKKNHPALFRAAAGSADGGRRDTNAPELKGGVDRLAFAYGKQSSARR